jgi:hypothetical protein
MFQKVVSTIAIFVLIITLCFIGLSLYRQKNTLNYPPVVASCPDYWDISGNLCINSMNLGKSNCNVPMDFTTSQWNSNESKCNKYTWATKCNLTWDGITDNGDVCGSKYDKYDNEK